jgi:agmatinase
MIEANMGFTEDIHRRRAIGHTLLVLSPKDHVDAIVSFDAHPDMKSEYLGSRLNYATYARRLVEKVFRIVHINSRALSAEEIESIKDTDVVKVINVEGARET